MAKCNLIISWRFGVIEETSGEGGGVGGRNLLPGIDRIKGVQSELSLCDNF